MQRENIGTALNELNRVMSGEIPAIYSASSCSEAILMGDKQVLYGILWHIWQYEHSQAKRNSDKKPLSPAALDKAYDLTLPPPPPPPSKELFDSAIKRLSVFGTMTHRLDATRATAASRAFDLDIPALALADAQERKKSRQILPKPTSIKDLYVSWEQDSALGDDIYSLPSSSTIRHAEPLVVMKAQAPVESIKRNNVVLLNKVTTNQAQKSLDEGDLKDEKEGDQSHFELPVDSAAATITSELPSEERFSAFNNENPNQEVDAKEKSVAEGTNELLKWLKQLNIRLPTPSAFQVRFPTWKTGFVDSDVMLPFAPKRTPMLVFWTFSRVSCSAVLLNE